MATVVSQIFAHEFFVELYCTQDCCCFSEEGRERGEESLHQGVEIHLPSVTVACWLSLVAVSNSAQGIDFS